MIAWNLLYEELTQREPDYVICERYLCDAGDVKPTDEVADKIMIAVGRQYLDSDLRTPLNADKFDVLQRIHATLGRPEPNKRAVCVLAFAVIMTISALALLVWAYSRTHA